MVSDNIEDLKTAKAENLDIATIGNISCDGIDQTDNNIVIGG
jgi:hypothetical protein